MKPPQPVGPPSRSGGRTASLLWFVLLVAIVSLAASLRFYRLGAQSLWNDEGNSARIAERSIGLIVEGAAGDVHPPAYYLLLHVWRGVFGESEFALRSLSAVAGVLLVVLTCLLGRHLFDPVTGLIAALFSALSPLAIYYSQEARMYAPLAALTAASTCLAFRAQPATWSREEQASQDPPLWLLAAYVLVNAAGLYTHYTFGFVLLAHNVLFAARWLLTAGRRIGKWKELSLWLVAQLAVVLLYLPWIPTALRAAGWPSAGGSSSMGEALRGVVRVLVVGITLPLSQAKAPMAGAVILLLAGATTVVGGLPHDHDTLSIRWHVAGLLVYLAIPLGLLLGLDLYKPAWLKFLVVLLPALHLLMARGICAIGSAVSQFWRRLGSGNDSVHLVVSIPLVAAMALLVYPSLHNLYFDPAYARDDYRRLSADIEEMWRSGDAIVLNAPNQWEVFTYYHPDRHVYPAPYRPRSGDAATFLAPLIDDYERLFVVYWGDAESDPNKRLESWLADHAYKAGDRWYGDVRLATYGSASLPEVPDRALDTLFGDRIRLRGCALVGETFSSGEIIPVTLYWEAVDAPEQPYKVTVQLLDRHSQLVSQIDTVPHDGLEPTTVWQPDELLVDRYGVRVPDGAVGGQYSLWVAVYHAMEGRRLPVTWAGEARDDAVLLGGVKVIASQ